MTERLLDSCAENRIEDVVLGHIEDIMLYLDIFRQLPEKEAEGSDFEYSQQISLIVLADLSSQLGLRVSEYMIGSDEIQNQMDDNTADVAIGILNRSDVDDIYEAYLGSARQINLPDFCENKAPVLVVSSDSVCKLIALSQDR